MSVQSLAAAALFATTVLAAGVLVKRADITTLSAGQIAELIPYAGFATAAYCKPSTTIDWSCGANCDLNPNFVPVASGGDSGLVQFWYVGYDPSSDSVIVGHQGTDTKNILAILTDADFILTPLDKTLFPGLPSSILVHNGFENSHARVATEVLAAVNSTLSQYSTSAVTVVGHSLGAALALLNGIYLKLHLPSGTKVQTIGFGMPRVGDKAWANYVDANFNVTHINNRKDPVPIFPPILLGYHHASGEVHIEDSGVWVSCPGQDNPSDQCIKGEVPTILQGNATDHNGPYNGVTMGCSTNS